MEHFDGGDKWQARQKLDAASRTHELVLNLVENIELHEVVRQIRIEDGMLGIEPFAIHHIPILEGLPKFGGIAVCPGLKQMEVAFTLSTHQKVASALKQQFAVGGEADGGVGPVHFLFNDQE